MKWKVFAGALLLATPVAAAGQQPPLEGTWRVASGADAKGGPREVIIRPDSSASWGEETVRWRLKPKNRIAIAIGDEWETYDLRVTAKELRLSGGDLQEAVTLRRVGPATPRAPGVPLPPPPPE
ncbi:MAG TPA: hypothetical protein VJ773_07480 [Gemmatimonadales bacterium]|nr:hypothetical protein [Gemmatimonadales bacterium]